MTTSILIESICDNKTLKNLSVPSCLFISPYPYPTYTFKFNENNDEIIDDKLYEYLISAVENPLSKKKNSKKLKKLTTQKSKKKKRIL